MAKDCLEHFEHAVDARNHPKIKALRASYGWEGVGRFWALNEIIGGTSNVRLDLSKKVYRATTAEDLGLSIQAFEEFLSFLCNPDECGLIKSIDGVVTTDKTTENWENLKAYRDREATRKAVSRGKTPLSGGQTQMSGGLPAENTKNPADSRPSSDELSSVKSLGVIPPISPTPENPSPAGLNLHDPDDPSPSGARKQNPGPTQINAYIEAWNSAGMIPFRKLFINVPTHEMGAVLEAVSWYTHDEVLFAISSYAKVQTDPEYHMGFRYEGGVLSFLTKGLASFAPAAKPLDRFARKVLPFSKPTPPPLDLGTEHDPFAVRFGDPQ